jgi:putative tryptophan/tyrosine transport system substrate-binding protein
MRRLALILPIAIAVVVAPFAVAAQQAAKVWRIALVLNTIPVAAMAGTDPIDRYSRAFVHGLRDLGYVEGRNIRIERRSAEGQLGRVPALVQELVGLKVDVMVMSGNIGTRAARQATDTIPIVGVTVDDPVALGLATSLARPGGNVTGLSTGSVDWGYTSKRLELLKEAVPKVSRVAVIRPSPEPHRPTWLPETEAAARALGLTLKIVVVDRPEDFEKAVATITQDRPEALMVAGNTLNIGHRNEIIDFAASRRLPTMYATREYSESGGLMAYGPDLTDQFRRAASYVDKVLKGANPGDLPIEQPTGRAGDQREDRQSTGPHHPPVAPAAGG